LSRGRAGPTIAAGTPRRVHARNAAVVETRAAMASAREELSTRESRTEVEQGSVRKSARSRGSPAVRAAPAAGRRKRCRRAHQADRSHDALKSCAKNQAPPVDKHRNRTRHGPDPTGVRPGEGIRNTTRTGQADHRGRTAAHLGARHRPLRVNTPSTAVSRDGRDPRLPQDAAGRGGPGSRWTSRRLAQQPASSVLLGREDSSLGRAFVRVVCGGLIDGVSEPVRANHGAEEQSSPRNNHAMVTYGAQSAALRDIR